MVTIKDIARELGLSVNTVSRALNGKPDVHPETKKRIEEAARRLGYVPNNVARSLVAGRSHTIGLIVADVGNPFSSKIIRGVEETARMNGYSTILANANEQDEDERQAVQVMLSKRVDGMLIHPVQASSDHIAQLCEARFPFVLLNRYYDEIDACCVLNNNQRGAYLGVRHLIELGHRHIVHITGPLQISSVRERIAGYRQALSEATISASDQMIAHTRVDSQGGYAATRNLIESKVKFTAIFTYSDLIAVGALKALREAGLRVPNDISLVGYDDIEFADFLEAPLTTIRQPMYEIGRCGTQILLDILRDPSHQRATCKQVLEPQLVIRRSSAATAHSV
jgi:LacI family transcriptional regulator